MLLAPAGRRLRSGRRRDVVLDDAEHAADETRWGSSWPARSGPGAVTRTSSAAARWWSAANMTPMADSTVEGPVGERQLLGVGLDEVDVEVLGRRATAGDLEQRRDVVACR